MHAEAALKFHRPGYVIARNMAAALTGKMTLSAPPPTSASSRVVATAMMHTTSIAFPVNSPSA